MARFQHIRSVLLLGSALSLMTESSLGQQPPAGGEPSGGRFRFTAPTLGGKQFWADELFCHDWRIQRNVLTGHYRLLDGRNVRDTWGSFEHCRKRLDEIKREQGLEPMRGKVVLALHGLIRTRSSMTTLCDRLKTDGGYLVFAVAYPTTQGDIAAFAAGLNRIIENLEGVEEIYLVGHSLGNLVIRHYLGDQTDPTTGRQPDPRIKRIVMIAPPNHGSVRAEAWADNTLFRMFAGRAGQQLAGGWAELAPHLAIPSCEFGIIAGGKGDDEGYSSRIPGDDDGTIGVATTRLPGARDFVVVPKGHTFITSHEDVMAYTLRFFNEGYFISAEQRQPIPASEPGT